jgi:hypothetical protein
MDAQVPEYAPSDVQKRRRGRFWMILVWLICAAPVVASYLTFYVFRPTSRHSYGELIEPQRELPDLVATDLNGKSQNLQTLKGQWLLISVASGACDKACQEHLYLQRQLRESLGKEKDRVQWVWLVADDAQVPADIQKALSLATVLRVAPVGLQQWLYAGPGHALQEHLYLVDPLGHWMMRFPPELDIHSAAKAKSDLDRVLRASASWDQAGR